MTSAYRQLVAPLPNTRRSAEKDRTNKTVAMNAMQ